ncbi:MAG: response regulator [Planctomycetota bacterium]|jgi:DNA-binding NarL/FixJ family response regulator
MRILFVENHAVFADVAIKHLLGEHQVNVVSRMTDAWARLCEDVFDVVLVDYDLEDGKGDELVWKIRRESLAIKVVAVSSHEAGNKALRAAGADAVCGKLEFEQIEDVLGSLQG